MTDTPETPSADEIAHHFTAMGHSVEAINRVIAGEYDDDLEENDRADKVDRNVRHLQIMKERDFWTNEDFAEVDAAITAGQAYLA